MNGIPDIEVDSDGEDAADGDKEENKSDEENLSRSAKDKGLGFGKNQGRVLCAPYFQIFKNGNIIYSTTTKK